MAKNTAAVKALIDALVNAFDSLPEETPTPVCLDHSHWDGTKCVCDAGYHDENGKCVPDSPPPPPPPPPPTTGLLYDSNVDIDWGTQKVVVNKDGNISANGKGFFTAASGSPKVEKDPAQKTLRLITQPGFGRFYLCVNNFNAQLDFDFNIESASVDNMSIKTRSRHQSGGDGPGGNRFGGLGNATSLTDTDFKIELYHNVHEQGYNKNLPQKLQLNKWYHKRYIYHNTDDNKGIKMEDWIDFNDGNGLIKVFERTETSPKPYAIDRTKFDQESWVWFRLNGNGSIVFKNIKITTL